MSAEWVQAVEAGDISDGEHYFIAMRPHTSLQPYRFQSRDIKGRMCWSVKPGIAVQFVGSEPLRQAMSKNAALVAVIVPPDAHKRRRRV